MQVWINTDNTKNAVALAETLEKAVQAHANQGLKAFVIFTNPGEEEPEDLTKSLEKMAADRNITHIGIAFLPNLDDNAVKDYGINTDARVRNTVFLYKNKMVASKFVNLKADKKGQEALEEAIQNLLR
ncbi:MAG TPA: hypothetical protein VFB38_16880 [Chthonomonadaceae bacterium]|nr:hypothetical protein [Chthonomonadaceae bacterium]